MDSRICRRDAPEVGFSELIAGCSRVTDNSEVVPGLSESEMFVLDWNPVNRDLAVCLSAHQSEISNILSVEFDGKAFEFDKFHECLTLPWRFDRDVAAIHRLLFEGHPVCVAMLNRVTNPSAMP
jgi:hypothetical protein